MRMLAACLLAASLLTSACGGGCDAGGDPDGEPTPAPAFAPTEAAVLSTGSPTKDEDPRVLRARPGSLYVAWFSNRGGNSDIYTSRGLRTSFE